MSKTMIEKKAEGYRIFLSYSHDDLEKVEKIVAILERNGLVPLWDKNFSWGQGFQSQIKLFIEHAHIFMPVISESSNSRGWVHQEIGYAMAHHIPVLPIAVGRNLPGQMIQELQAVKWTTQADFDELENILSIGNIQNLINLSEGKSRPMYECANFHQDRTMMLVEYAKTVHELFKNHPAPIRQAGALSSFHLPDKFMRHPDWKARIGNREAMEFGNYWLRKERRIFESTARIWGFKIIIDPALDFEQFGDKNTEVRISRLKTLLEFFQSLPEGESEKFGVILNSDLEKYKNLVIFGDLFMAVSLAGHKDKGYQQTMFTRHALTIQENVEMFDSEFEEGLKKQGTEVKDSLQFAIDKINSIINSLKNRK